MTVVRRQRLIYIPTPSVLFWSICDKYPFWLGTLSVGAVLARRTDSSDEACSKPVGQQRCRVDQVAVVLSGENGLVAAAVEFLGLLKDLKKSLDSSISHASDMQLSMLALEPSSSNSLARMSSDQSPDMEASRTR